MRNPAWSERKKRAASATSSSVALRPRGLVAAVASMICAGGRPVRPVFHSTTRRPISVVGQPTGHTQLAVTPAGASSAATDSVSPTSPNLDAT
ncbi:hypothetical protein LUX33_48885 [Actinomadura madurae]|nr:hypothetical protein [Actinomadura madurae]MCP9955493.1 hypothetical protein [Actinomadura madurae]